MRDSISATSATIADADDTGMFAWWRAADGRARHAFVAASLGWMLDSFDVMLYSLVLASLIQDPTLQLSTAVAGQLGALTLLSAAVGAWCSACSPTASAASRRLMAAVLIYSIFTAACGLVQNVAQLAICRILLGFGMGGEWATGVALVSETFPAKHRGKALAFVQSSWAIGYGLAALVNLLVMPVWGWRGVFFVGVRRHCSPCGSAARSKTGTLATHARPPAGDGELLHAGAGARHRLHHPDERLLPVRLVGPQPVGAGYLNLWRNAAASA
jgi:nitrate/nitrite transporter NarK